MKIAKLRSKAIYNTSGSVLSPNYSNPRSIHSNLNTLHSQKMFTLAISQPPSPHSTPSIRIITISIQPLSSSRIPDRALLPPTLLGLPFCARNHPRTPLHAHAHSFTYHTHLYIRESAQPQRASVAPLFSVLGTSSSSPRPGLFLSLPLSSSRTHQYSARTSVCMRRCALLI